RCGATRGASSTTVQSTFTGRQPAAATASTTRARRPRLSAPAHTGSVSGKWSPRSPRAAAPRRASAMAWLTTSASLWPARPRSPANCTPPRTRRREGSSLKAWTSKPMPTRTAMSPTLGAVDERPGHEQVVLGRDLGVGRFTGDDHDAATDRFNEGGVVGAFSVPGVGAAQGACGKGLRRLHGDQTGAIERLGDGHTVDSLDGVGHRHAWHG